MQQPTLPCRGVAVPAPWPLRLDGSSIRWHLSRFRSRALSWPFKMTLFMPSPLSLSGMENDDTAVQYAIGRSDTVAPGTGIDLEFDADVQTMSPEASEYETCYVTSHKGPCRVATYSRDGQLIATGSADASIKILDTERMLAKSAMPIEVRVADRTCEPSVLSGGGGGVRTSPAWAGLWGASSGRADLTLHASSLSATQVMMNETAQQNMENHPVIRTLYDHVDEVTCLAFHPTEQILASGSRDYTLKLFDYSKPSAKRAFKYIQVRNVWKEVLRFFLK